jgi:hypothetical protein
VKTEELIVLLKQHPGKVVLSWGGDMIEWEEIKRVEVRIMRKEGNEWLSTYSFDEARDVGPGEEVLLLL